MFECECSSENPKPPCRGSTLEPDSLKAAEDLALRGCFLNNLASMRHNLRRPKAPFEKRRFDWNTTTIEQTPKIHKGVLPKASERKPSSLPDDGRLNPAYNIGDAAIAIF